MKKKLIAIFAIFILSFNIMAYSRQEKTEASALLISYAIFKAGVSFTAFTGFASLMAVNGYHMQLSDMAVAFADKYYDYANGVYTQKGSKINVLEKLSLATASFISGNDPLSISELNDIKNDIVAEYPKIVDVGSLTSDEEILGKMTSGFEIPTARDLNGFYQIDSSVENKLYKIFYDAVPSDWFYYIDTSNVGWLNVGNYWYPSITVILPDGKTFQSKAYDYYRMLKDTSTQSFRIQGKMGRDNYVDLLQYYMPGFGDGYTYEVVKDSFADGVKDFIKAFPNYYSALSGKASTTEELIGLMNTDEYLQREVAKLLENQKVNEENTLQVPTVVDGVITYPTADIPDIPDVPDVPYSPTETWYNDLLGWITNIPDLLIGGITDLFNDTLIPALDSLKDLVIQIPDLLTNIWNWILDFPDLLYSWFVPTAPMIAETWEPVMDLWDLKLDPIIAPFKTLTFYEAEYQDISIPLKFGSYEKEHKIIDFQYIKSQRDSIKSLIRAFLWILIIFFNLDQIHRLIRNQSLLNTYVRKIDKGA